MSYRTNVRDFDADRPVLSDSLLAPIRTLPRLPIENEIPIEDCDGCPMAGIVNGLKATFYIVAAILFLCSANALATQAGAPYTPANDRADVPQGFSR